MKTTTHGKPQRNQIASEKSMKEFQDDALNREMTHQAPSSPIRSIGYGFHQGSISKPKAAESRTTSLGGMKVSRDDAPKRDMTH